MEETAMAKHLLSVWHDDDHRDMDFGSEEAQRVVSQVGAFNAVRPFQA
jgi:hypothetical protein